MSREGDSTEMSLLGAADRAGSGSGYGAASAAVAAAAVLGLPANTMSHSHLINKISLDVLGYICEFIVDDLKEFIAFFKVLPNSVARALASHQPLYEEVVGRLREIKNPSKYELHKPRQVSQRYMLDDLTRKRTELCRELLVMSCLCVPIHCPLSLFWIVLNFVTLGMAGELSSCCLGGDESVEHCFCGFSRLSFFPCEREACREVSKAEEKGNLFNGNRYWRQDPVHREMPPEWSCTPIAKIYESFRKDRALSDQIGKQLLIVRRYNVETNNPLREIIAGVEKNYTSTMK